MPLNRQTRKRATLLTSLSLASLSAAIVLPPSNSGSVNLAGASSVRKTLNFGPHIEKAHHSTSSNPSPALRAWNSAAPAISLASGDLAGKDLARAFVETLHPGAEFRLVDGYLSKHTNVFHAHFLQTVGGVDVANGNLNVNIDLDTNEVLSYGDSSFVESAGDAATLASSWKNKVSKWASGAASEIKEAAQAGQMVFGGAPVDDGPQHQEDILAEYSSPPLVASSPVPQANDPRHGLLTFLALQSPTTELSNVLLKVPRDRLVQRMPLETVRGDQILAHTIEAVPSALEPVKASLVYVHDGSKLRLAWKYEILTDDNQYEAYVEADAAVAGEEETLLVVDWVRDFRPTGGEIGIESLQNAAKFSSRRSTKSFGGRKPKLGGLSPRSGTDDAAVLQSSDKKAADPTYNVFPWGVNAPDVGKRELLHGKTLELVKEASPAGWHTVPAEFKGGKDTIYLDTRGNNVIAQDNPDGGNSMNGYRPSGGANLTFDFKLGWPKAGTPLEPKTYINASITQLFYTNNEIHDLFHGYGFDEPAGNFQEYNFGRGGQGGDAVQANSQDGSGTNNANFATPPDGSRPRMRMYYWTGSQPYRDGDFEAGIVIHEYAHGISTRLTGGPANSGCLGWGEAGGMGEGIGDYIASLVRTHDKNETEWDMGSWASSRAGGIRNFPYSTNMTVNPSTYSILDKPGYWGVHAIGEVWAVMGWEVAQNLIKKHGFSKNLFPPTTDDKDDFWNSNYKKKVPKHGNTLALQLLVDSLKIQPCRPSFSDARDAMLTADKALTGGDNACEIWAGFSKRGLGPEAQLVGGTPWGGGQHRNDYDLPKACRKTKQ